MPQFGRTGAPDLTVVEWPDGGDANHEEPACGAHYQPYGPVELAYVTAMIAEVALDSILRPPEQSFSRVFVASERRIAALGVPTLFIMEGGYAVEAIGVNAVNVLEGFEGV